MRFSDALRQAGLLPREIVADGKIRRCGTESKARSDNGWYVLHPDGHGVWGDWASGSGAMLGSWRDERATSAERTAESIAAMRKRREQERAARQRAISEARAYWHHSGRHAVMHPYLEAKGLSMVGTAGLRVHMGKLVVPVMFGDRLISVQTITADGDKRFWPGAPVKAGAFEIVRDRAAITCYVEGLATGLAVYQCVRSARVVVAFDAGNLLPVMQRMRPTGSVVIAADNDWRTLAKRGFNPGVDKAKAAAELIGCGVAYPGDIEGTDWADALKEWGSTQGPRRIERQIVSMAKFVVGGAMS